MSTAGALAPYRVLDLTTERAWLTGKLLADLGADVIKVEPPGGDPGRLLPPFAGDEQGPDTGLRWWSYNRGKRSVAVDLASDDGRRLLLDLAAVSHVVLESFEPGALEGLGLGFDALAAANAAIVLTRVTPFGQDGPYAHWAANDLAIAASGGPASVTGDPDRAPVRISVPQYFHHAAAEAAVHTLVALQHAARTGIGQVVDVSAQAAAPRTMMDALHYATTGNPVPPRSFFGAPTWRTPLPSVFRCADGYVTGAIGGPTLAGFRQWLSDAGEPVPAYFASLPADAFTKTMWEEQPPLLAEELIAATTAFFATRTKKELCDEAVRYRQMLVPVNTIADILADDQLADRGYFTEVDHDGRAVRFPSVWARMPATPLRDSPRAPHLDEHGDEIRKLAAQGRELAQKQEA